MRLFTVLKNIINGDLELIFWEKKLDLVDKILAQSI